MSDQPNHKATTYAQDNTDRINPYTQLNIHGIRTHNPSICTNEGSSYLRPHGYCDWLFTTLLNIKHLKASKETTYVRFEVFMVVTMKKAIFWDVVLC